MTENEAIAKVDRELDVVRKRLLALPLGEFGHEYSAHFHKPPDFSKGQANLVEQIILDMRQRALGG
jgi:hypothetical protein